MRWRLVAPNAVTALSLVLAVLSIESAVAGRPVDAAWWALYCCLTDKLDGLLAHALGASSALGVQLDSLADLVAFGVAPSTVLFAFYTARPELGWAAGCSGLLLRAICGAFVVAAALRLARFNVAAAAGRAAHYRGLPSTMTAGLLLALFVLLLKYADPALTRPETFDRWRWLGTARLDGALRWLPLGFLGGAAAMLSPLRVPRLGRTRRRATDALLVALVAVGYVLGLLRQLPEYLVAGAAVWLAVSVAYHLRTRTAN
jgi:phosphatidylserine synthase